MAEAGDDAQRPLRGILAILAAMACMAMLDACAKWLGAGYPVGQIVFFRNLFGLLPILFVVWRSGGVNTLRSGHPGLHLCRALAMVTAGFSFFYALKFLPLAEAMALAFVAPLFVTALSVPLLGERVGLRRWAAVCVGGLGVLIVLRPGAAAFRWEALLPVLAAFAYGLASVLTRRMARHDSNAAIMFHGTCIAMLCAAATLPFAWRLPTPPDFAVFLLLGLVGGVGMYFLTVAYRSAPAAVIAPFEYSVLLWALLLGWAIWRELPDIWVWAGAGVIAASGFYIARREARLAREQRDRVAAPAQPETGTPSRG